MTTPPRPRGRPRGASQHNRGDATLLDKVADLVTDASPALKPTSAMRRLGITDLSALRRLQRKWRPAGPRLTEAVRERRRRASQPRQPATSFTEYASSQAYAVSRSPSTLAALAAGHSAMREFERSQAFIAAATGATSMLGGARGFLDMMESPGMRMMRQMQESEQRMRDIIDPPGQRMMRERMERDRRMQDLIDPPHTRALRRAAMGFGY